MPRAEREAYERERERLETRPGSTTRRSGAGGDLRDPGRASGAEASVPSTRSGGLGRAPPWTGAEAEALARRFEDAAVARPAGTRPSWPPKPGAASSTRSAPAPRRRRDADLASALASFEPLLAQWQQRATDGARMTCAPLGGRRPASMARRQKFARSRRRRRRTIAPDSPSWPSGSRPWPRPRLDPARRRSRRPRREDAVEDPAPCPRSTTRRRSSAASRQRARPSSPGSRTCVRKPNGSTSPTWTSRRSSCRGPRPSGRARTSRRRPSSSAISTPAGSRRVKLRRTRPRPSGRASRPRATRCGPARRLLRQEGRGARAEPREEGGPLRAGRGPAESTDWLKTAEALKQLQAEWKEVGPIAHHKAKPVWDRFRKACDHFFSRRDEDRTKRREEGRRTSRRSRPLREGRGPGLVERLGRAAAEIKALQAEWKQVGPVRASQSDAVWQRFRAACDLFFDRYKRRDELADEAAVAAREALCGEADACRGAGGRPRGQGARGPGHLASGQARIPREGRSAEHAIRGRGRPGHRSPACGVRGHRARPDRDLKKMDKLCAKVEAAHAAAAPEGQAAAVADLATRLRDALASNTIGGRDAALGKWREATTEVEAAEAAWLRLGPARGRVGEELRARFERARAAFLPPGRRSPSPRPPSDATAGPGPSAGPGLPAPATPTPVASARSILRRVRRHSARDRRSLCRGAAPLSSTAGSCLAGSPAGWSWLPCGMWRPRCAEPAEAGGAHASRGRGRPRPSGGNP